MGLPERKNIYRLGSVTYILEGYISSTLVCLQPISEHTLCLPISFPQHKSINKKDETTSETYGRSGKLPISSRPSTPRYITNNEQLAGAVGLENSFAIEIISKKNSGCEKTNGWEGVRIMDAAPCVFEPEEHEEQKLEITYRTTGTPMRVNARVASKLKDYIINSPAETTMKVK